MGLDGNAILLSMLIGGIGFVAFAYGKKQSRFPQMLAGLLLMGFPYFVSNLWLMVGIAVGILVLMYGAIRAGA